MVETIDGSVKKYDTHHIIKNVKMLLFGLYF